MSAVDWVRLLMLVVGVFGLGCAAVLMFWTWLNLRRWRQYQREMAQSMKEFEERVT